MTESQEKPSLILTEEAYITTHTHLLNRRLKEIGIDPGQAIDTKYQVIAGQMCIEITQKEKKDAV